jgi:cobalt/nickel transport system permease protein
MRLMTRVYDAADCPNSPLSRLDARWKLAAIVLFIAAAAWVRTPEGTAIAAYGAAVLLLLSRLPAKLLLARLGGFSLFLLPFLVILPLFQGSRGIEVAALVGVRALTLFTLGLVLVTTSPMHRNIQAAQALGVPIALTQIALLSYRYLFVIRDEFQRIRVALRVRGFRSGANGRTYRLVGHVAAMLLVRGDERAQRVGHAMRCRGFDGRIRSLSPFQTRTQDVMFVVIVGLFSAALVAGDLALRY